MRTARKLTLLAALAVAATALAAPSALAQLTHNQTPRLIVQQETHTASDVSCPAVLPSPPPNPPPLTTSGGCRVHLASAGNITFVGHTMGGMEVVDDICSLEANMRIDVDGEGYLTHQELTGAGCDLRACEQLEPPTDEGRAWSFYMREMEPPQRTEVMVLRLCVSTLMLPGQIHYEFTLPLSQTSVHRYRIAASDTREHSPIINITELTGNIDVEATLGTTGEDQAEQNVEIRHT